MRTSAQAVHRRQSRKRSWQQEKCLWRQVALPHGVEAAKKRVLQSGISVQTFKEPIDWDGNPVRIVIGIAGVGDAHLDVLAQIAEAMLDEEVSANIADYDADKIYKVLTGKE